MARSKSSPSPAEDELFTSILSAEDRDRCPAARPVVSYSDTDPNSYLDAIETCAVSAVSLARRGVYHGEWAELAPDLMSPALRGPIEERSDDEFEAAILARWHAAKPIVLHGVAGEMLDEFGAEIEGAVELHEALGEVGGLRAWLAGNAEAIAPEFVVRAQRATLADPERDIERVLVEARSSLPNARKIDDLWLKSAWLSTFDEDSSARLRFSFGRERDDDASRDIVRHRLVAELAARLLPETALVTANPALAPLVERLCSERVLFTQHIAYWNSPQGGALFHHDAFAEDAFDGGGWRQFGVCYLQLSGRTAWLALSIQDLAMRVREFADLLDEGELPWVRAQLFENGAASVAGGWRRFRELVDDEARLVAELGFPGCGVLGALVNRGPEFTSFLADAGHAWVLSPGDAILLPNQGVQATCMHSVFCASEDTGYSLSLAIRPDREAPEEALEREAAHRRKVMEKKNETSRRKQSVMRKISAKRGAHKKRR